MAKMMQDKVEKSQSKQKDLEDIDKKAKKKAKKLDKRVNSDAPPPKGKPEVESERPEEASSKSN